MRPPLPRQSHSLAVMESWPQCAVQPAPFMHSSRMCCWDVLQWGCVATCCSLRMQLDMQPRALSS